MFTSMFSRKSVFSVPAKSPRRRERATSLSVGEQLEHRHAMAVVLSLTGPTSPVPEGQQAVLTITLSEASRVPQRVTITTTPGSATYGVDYFAPARQTILFMPGQMKQTVSIATLRDSAGDKVEGRETFTVKATPDDPKIAARSQGVTIVDTTGATPLSKFQITLDYLTTDQGSVPVAVQDACQWAAQRWSQVIVGDLPDVRLPNGKVIDDIVIRVQMGLLQETNAQGGVLANAGPTAFRTGSAGLPYEAAAGIDPFDATSTDLRSLLLHEFGHALGMGSWLWSRKSLTQTPTADNPIYIGKNAVREFNRIFGTTGTSVPVENTGMAGSIGSHWRESVLDAEIMTSLIEPTGVAMRLSAITAGAMQDLGYVVNYAMADAYSKPAARLSGQPITGRASESGLNSLNQAFVKAFAAIAEDSTVSAKPRSAYRRPAVA